MGLQIIRQMYWDPQMAQSALCPGCGREIYAPGYHCPECEGRTEDDTQGDEPEL